MPFEFTAAALAGVVLVQPRVFPDERGSFCEIYKESEFRANGISDVFVQDNSSNSSVGVVRGLHFQNPPHAQAKLIRCVSGSIYDVVIDIRVGSPTYGQWEGFTLSAENLKMLYVPVGFAHGFAVTSAVAEITYKVSHEYHASSESGIIWNDPDLEIQWPVESPLVSEKDLQLPVLKNADNGFDFD